MSDTSTFDEIIHCTRSLIVAGGYNGFSYADIASVVGIRKPSIHHHFPTKADLVRKVVSDYREEAVAAVRFLEEHVRNPLGQLSAYVSHWEKCIEDNTAPFCVCAMLASELPLLPKPVAAEVSLHFEGLSQWVVSLFERASENGSIKLQKSPAVEAEVFIATVHGAMLSARACGNPALFRTIVGASLERIKPN